jgi:hypothetical protein
VNEVIALIMSGDIEQIRKVPATPITPFVGIQAIAKRALSVQLGKDYLEFAFNVMNFMKLETVPEGAIKAITSVFTDASLPHQAFSLIIDENSFNSIFAYFTTKEHNYKVR